jgi:hypothetical protein
MERFIDNLYNGSRMHTSIGDISPNEFEAQTGEVGT